MSYQTPALLLSLIILTRIIDDLFLGFSIHNSQSVISLIPLWYLAASIGGLLISLQLSKEHKQKIKRLKENKFHVSIYLFIAVFGAIFWFLTIDKIGISGNAIVSNFQIIIVLLFSLFVLKEKLKPTQLVSAFFVVVGILVFGYSSDTNTKIGILFAIIPLIESSISNIYYKILSTKVPAEILITMRAFFIMISTIVIMVLFNIKLVIPQSFWVLCTIIVGGISGPILNKYFTMELLKKYKLSLLTLFNTIIPVIIFILGVFLLHEMISIQKVIGGSIVFIGLLFLLKHEKHKHMHITSKS